MSFIEFCFWKKIDFNAWSVFWSGSTKITLFWAVYLFFLSANFEKLLNECCSLWFCIIKPFRVLFFFYFLCCNFILVLPWPRCLEIYSKCSLHFRFFRTIHFLSSSSGEMDWLLCWGEAIETASLVQALCQLALCTRPTCSHTQNITVHRKHHLREANQWLGHGNVMRSQWPSEPNGCLLWWIWNTLLFHICIVKGTVYITCFLSAN